MSLYLITYSKDKPKSGHKGIEHKKIVTADSAALAMARWLTTAGIPANVYSLTAEWVGDKVIE